MIEMLDKRLVGLLIIVGIVAGLVGAFYTHLLHYIQHFVYQYSSADGLTFGQAVARIEPEYRFLILLACGLVGGIGWFLIHRFGEPLVDLKKAVQDRTKEIPPLTTFIHATLQIVTVGMGSPLGREVAPREASAGIMSGLLKHVDMRGDDKSLIIACAAGAGLAAVYNSPLSAAIFTLETLVISWNIRSMSAALLSCGIATLVTRQAGVGDTIQYAMAQPPLYGSYQEFAIVLGAVIAIGVLLFDKTQALLPKFDRKSPKMIIISVIAFGAVGAMAMFYPEILGNGKAGNQLTFTDLVSWDYALGLLATKWIAVLLALMAGAYGGRITPSMMLGSTLSLAFAALWSIMVSPVSLGFAAFLGAVIFLGLAQKMPITSSVFMLELSRFSVEMFFPITLAMGSALIVQQILKVRFSL